MKESEFAQRAMAEKERLYRTALIYLGGEAAAPDYDALPLRDAVARLPQELRAVVVLRYFSGYTLAETAEILSLPAGTVSTRQRKALALLRLELCEEV